MVHYSMKRYKKQYITIYPAPMRLLRCFKGSSPNLGLAPVADMCPASTPHTPRLLPIALQIKHKHIPNPEFMERVARQFYYSVLNFSFRLISAAFVRPTNKLVSIAASLYDLGLITPPFRIQTCRIVLFLTLDCFSARRSCRATRAD
jgi:hypothetical protein